MMLRSLLIAILLPFALVTPAISQTCHTETAVPSSTPANRFADNGNGTVTDKSTGLMWAHCPEGVSDTYCLTGSATTFTWEGALNRAKNSDLAGYTDWRLPTIKELSSLVEERCYAPSINLTVFPNTPTSYFWSASPNASSSSDTWYVGFYNGFAYYGNRSSSYHVRLVRSGQ